MSQPVPHYEPESERGKPQEPRPLERRLDARWTPEQWHKAREFSRMEVTTALAQLTRQMAAYNDALAWADMLKTFDSPAPVHREEGKAE